MSTKSTKSAKAAQQRKAKAKAAQQRKVQATTTRLEKSIQSLAASPTQSRVAKLQAAIGDYVEARGGRPVPKKYRTKVQRILEAANTPEPKRVGRKATKQTKPKPAGFFKSIWNALFVAEPAQPEPVLPDFTQPDDNSSELRQQELDQIMEHITAVDYNHKKAIIVVKPWLGSPAEQTSTIAEIANGSDVWGWSEQLDVVIKYAVKNMYSRYPDYQQYNAMAYLVDPYGYGDASNESWRSAVALMSKQEFRISKFGQVFSREMQRVPVSGEFVLVFHKAENF